MATLDEALHNPEIRLSNGEKYHPAMQVQTEQEATEYLHKLVMYHASRYDGSDGARTSEQIYAIERGNIGYWTGYFDGETYERVNRLFKSVHPVFGEINPFKGN
jgi:hypothetical protein